MKKATRRNIRTRGKVYLWFMLVAYLIIRDSCSEYLSFSAFKSE